MRRNTIISTVLALFCVFILLSVYYQAGEQITPVSAAASREETIGSSQMELRMNSLKDNFLYTENRKQEMKNRSFSMGMRLIVLLADFGALFLSFYLAGRYARRRKSVSLLQKRFLIELRILLKKDGKKRRFFDREESICGAVRFCPARIKHDLRKFQISPL